ncbi:MAG: prohibitin family protein [Candidatus Altiarchaeota archaeon]|nr:prohibitin family protein [Candidatus Altiarchaeota archaeon]
MRENIQFEGLPGKIGFAFGVFPLIIAVLVAFLFTSHLFIASVGPGEVGVKFNYLSGGIEEEEFGEGWHLKPPWVYVTNYNVRTQEYTMSSQQEKRTSKAQDESILTISKDGLNVNFDITMLYHIVPEKASEIHKTIGPDYGETIILTLTRTSIRDVAGEYFAMDMHQKRPEMASKIYAELKPMLAERNIVLEQVLVRSIVRPQQIENAIENKLEAEQEALKMEFIIQKEEKEAERKGIEAEGIAKANEIIGESLTQNYLSWYWISNLDSHNSVMYVPINEQGFPMFKDIDKT